MLNRSGFYDFVIAVFTPDDDAIIRSQHVKVTRDNVIFEVGLFLGRLGPNRTFFVLHKDVEMFSDWKGIEPVTFQWSDNLVSAVDTACNKIKEEMRIVDNLECFSLLPSTSLAIGYYNNFLRRVFDGFENSDSITIIEKDTLGKIIKKEEVEIKNKYPLIEIRIPSSLRDLDHDTFKRRTSSLKQITIETKIRTFPFYIDGDYNIDKFTLYDFPTTLFASHLTITKIFTSDFLARDNNLENIEEREISNFEKTIRIMAPNDLERKYLRFKIIKD